MDLDILIGATQDFSRAFLDSYFFAALKIFLGIYTIVLIVDIVLLLYMRDVREDLKKTLYGTKYVPLITKAGMTKKWAAIERRLESGNPSEYKVAIIEADSLVNDIVKELGYEGDDMAKRLDRMALLQPEDAETLRSAHQIRNRIVFEQDFSVDRTQANEVLETFKEFLKKLEYFS